MGNRRHRASVAIGAALSLALVAGACGEKQDPAGSSGSDEDVSFQEDDSLEVTPGGTVTYGLGAETDGWNPTANRWATSGHQVSMALYDHLAEISAEGVPEPYLAESIEADESYTTWTITVREGVTFHDGSELTASDLELNFLAHKASPLSGKALAPIESMEVDPDDELTLKVTMSSPWASFPYFLTSQVGVVVEPGALGMDPETKTATSPATANTKPVGTGPFVFDEWEIDRQLVVTKNPDYWREGLPYLDEVVFQPVIDPNNRVNSLTAGDLGVLQMAVSASGIEALRDAACTEDPCPDGTVKYYDNQKNAEGEEGMLMVQALRPPFDDPIARRAVASGINREDLLETVFGGIYEPAMGFYAPDSKWYEDVSDKVPPFDPAEAEKLAQQYEAEHGEPIKFEFSIPVSMPEVEDSAQVVKEQLGAVGIEVDVKSYEMTKYIEKLIGGDFQGIAFKWFSAPDPDAEYVWLHSSSVPTDADGNPLPTGGISLNFARLVNPEVDAALEAGRATDDEAVRKEAYAAMQQALAEDLVFMTLYHGYSVVAWRPDIRNVVNWTFPDGTEGQPLNSSGAHPIAEMWVEQ